MTEESKTEETMPEEVAPQQDLQITAGDVALMVKIIDAGAERGAWRGEEMGTIGGLRSKMAAIVRAVAPVEDSVAEDAEGSEEEVVEEDATEETVVEEPVETKPKRKRGSKSAA